MAITILGITLGGEATRKKEVANAYAIKYPISGDINALRQTLGKAVIELADLKGATFESAADKRTQQRNVSALTTQTINLQNAINDANLYIGNASNNYTLKLPKFNIKSPYSTNTIVDKSKNSKVVVGLDKTTQQEVVDNTDGGQPQVETENQGAKGDYPPPQGVQKTNYGKWIGLGVLVIGVSTIGYVFLNKKK
jgi:hypothetical protein